MQDLPDTLPTVHPLAIPKRHIPAFESIRDLDDSTFASLLISLQTAKPTRRVDHLAAHMSESASIGVDLCRAILEALTEFTSLTDQWSAKPESLADRAAANIDLAVDPEARSRFASRVLDLAESTSLKLLGKAIALGFEHARILTESRLFTDLRPIFDNTLDDYPRPEAMLMVHTLKLEYIAPDNALKSIYVVLDENDIDSLSETLARARQKSDILKSTLAEVGIIDMSQDENRES